MSKKEKKEKLGDVRIPIPRTGISFKDKSKYNRKKKYKNKEENSER